MKKKKSSKDEHKLKNKTNWKKKQIIWLKN